MSPTIAEITKALSAAQGAIQCAAKDSKNPFFKSRYADLAAIWNAARKPLTDNGLAISQLLSLPEGKRVKVHTLLLHTSGERLSSELEMPLEKTDPQSIGSAFTYARRYALAAIAGIVTEGEDDDGNAASQVAHKPEVVRTYGDKYGTGKHLQSAATGSQRG